MRVKCPSFLNCEEPYNCWPPALSSCAAAVCLCSAADLIYSAGDSIYRGVFHSHSVSIRNSKDTTLFIVGIVCIAFGALGIFMTRKFIKMTINNVSAILAERERRRRGYAAIV